MENNEFTVSSMKTDLKALLTNDENFMLEIINFKNILKDYIKDEGILLVIMLQTSRELNELISGYDNNHITAKEVKEQLRIMVSLL